MRTIGFWAKCAALLLLATTGLAVHAEPTLHLQKINDHVYAIVGPFGNRTPENLGNNATFGLVITDEGAVLIDAGGTYDGAAAIQQLIGTVTDKPVRIVINTGGQDHRWLGNGYFKEHGARIIASRAAVEDQRARVQDQFFMLGNLVGAQAVRRTEPVYADEPFEDTKRFALGGITFEVRRVGPAHTPGDSIVWLPQEQIVFGGDIVFVGRLLGVMDHSDSRHWVRAFEAMAALNPAVVVPGHGPATDMAHARRDTYDYLVFLRKTVAAFMEAGGDITQIGTLDQSRFAYLADYDELKGRNAQQVFQAMEWE